MPGGQRKEVERLQGNTSYPVQPDHDSASSPSPRQAAPPRQVPPPVVTESIPDTYPPVVTSNNVQVEVHTSPAKKSLVDAYILCIALGFLGAHHFYLRRPLIGIIYMFTFGLLGGGWFIDIFRLPLLVKEANKRPAHRPLIEKKNLSDAYVFWLPCGFLGFHHFYLRRPLWGLLYLFTIGLFGVGWLIDGIRMKKLVDDANKKILEGDMKAFKKTVADTYVITIIPFTGLLGVQHYYLGRYLVGLYYTFTFGGLGVAWFMDCCRIPSLVKEYNESLFKGVSGKKRLDDAYMYLVPFGFLGFHHFYLHRYGWGLLYMFSLGLLGVGWLIDIFRLPILVKEFNEAVTEGRSLVDRAQAGHSNYGINGGSDAQATGHTLDSKALEAGILPPNNTIQHHSPPPEYPYPTQGNYQHSGFPTAYQEGGPYPQYYPSPPSGSNQALPNHVQIPPSYQEVVYAEEGHEADNVLNKYIDGL